MAVNIADLFEHAVDAAPDNLAVKVGDRSADFAELERESNKLAHYLQAQGVKPGDHVALYAKNSVEHVIGLLATLKVRAVTINVNYRYVEAELNYLFENADVVALLFERTYADLVAKCAPQHPKLNTFVALPDVLDPDNADDISSFGGVTLEEAIAGQSDERDFDERSADDIHIIYTGGTTGFPKGVMWRHEDFWRTLGGGIDFYTGEPLEGVRPVEDRERPADDDVPAEPPDARRRPGGAAHAPLRRPPDDPRAEVRPAATWEIIDKEKVQLIFMTGDAMALPLIDEYDRKAATGTPYDGSSLFAISSSAAIFSPQVKKRWMDIFTNAIFTDSIGATETGFTGMGMQDKNAISTDGPVVALGPNSVVLDDDNQPIDPSNVGAIGRLARGGSVPVGYYRDPEKSAKTFIEVNGARFSVPGDNARIEEDGKVTLLGRGSNCVNTGGEKVYPEEVEMAVKNHPAVYDCLVVGVPDEKYGQAVSAVVSLREGTTLELDELREFLRSYLSGYKLPRALTIVDEVPRNATGKAQYPKAKEMALAHPAV